ncbi:MAG: TonB-dependent receptor [Woeseiaceae bacterium]|nr:TonB-dependent receptor [Woeseiaceae bacterium]
MADSNREQQSFTLKPVSQAVLSACGASIALTAPTSGAAQEGSAIDEIVVTARKRTENLQDIPMSVIALSSDVIEKQGVTSLEDYARLIPSLTYSSWLPGNSMVVFRGVTVTADAFSGNSSAGIYFNEMPIQSQGLNPEVALVDMERLEAVSGPQPTTYGASAQSGVLKFVTARPNLSGFDGYVEVSGSYVEHGEAGYDFQAAVNIPLIEDVFALRAVGFNSKVGGYVDNIVGSTAQTHDYSAAFESPPGLTAYPGGFGPPSNIARVTKTNHDVAEDNVGDIETDGVRLTAAWAPSDEWLVTGLVQYQSMHVDGIASWHPEFGDLNQIRFKNETKDDDWYITTLVFEGDLGFADFTSATGFMHRNIIYDLDSSTYLHQFQGVGGVYYNSFDIAYFPMGYYYAYAFTVGYPAYNGTITGWTFNGLNAAGYPTYLITELTDNTSRMWDDFGSNRFTQEIRLTSKDEGQRFQWMLGGFYERYEDDYVFRGFADNYGNSIAAQIINNSTGLVARNPGQSWFGTGKSEETQWAVFGELGFDITDNLNVLVGLRYFDAETDDRNQSLNADGTASQNCLEDATGVCITSPEAVTPDNRIGTFGGVSSARETDTLPLVTLTYTLSDDILTYATRAEGFRTGGTNIIRALSTANRQFDADNVINNEIGLKMTLLGGRLNWNISAYQMTWEDMQLVAADPTIDFGWGQVTVNAGEAEIDGVETNFAFAATDRWRFDGALAFTETDVTEGASIGDDVVVAVGEELPLSPEWKVSLGAEYGFPIGNSSGWIRADYSYVDEQTNATQGSTLLTSSTLLRGAITTMPSYSIGNLTFGMENEDWSLRFALNNIADKRAVTYKPTRWTDGRLYSVRPREFVVSFRYNF